MAYELNAETVAKVIDALQDERAENNFCYGYCRTLSGSLYKLVVHMFEMTDKQMLERDDIYVID